jgi:hypothetical protein
MRLHLEWTLPIQLKDGSRDNLIYNVDQSKIPTREGVYVFGRRFGKDFEALYVGKANNIRGRIRGQLKNLPLMLHLKKAKLGKRVVLAGRFIPLPGQKAPKCLDLIERTLIRYFLSEGHDLVNKLGTRLRQHEIVSSGKHPKKLIPRRMYLDRAKGE